LMTSMWQEKPSRLVAIARASHLARGFVGAFN